MENESRSRRAVIWAEKRNNPPAQMLDGETWGEYLSYSDPFYVESDVTDGVETFIVRNAEGIGLAGCDTKEAAELIVAALDSFAARRKD